MISWPPLFSRTEKTLRACSSHEVATNDRSPPHPARPRNRDKAFCGCLAHRRVGCCDPELRFGGCSHERRADAELRVGRFSPESGSISMNAVHLLWAFGNPSSGTRFDGMMTVPSDFTKIPYPEFYQRIPSFSYTVPDPYCAIATGVVAYPASYLGAFPLPAIQGAPLPAALSRGAAVKDYWHYGLTDPSTNAGCSGDLHAAFLNTLQRLRKLGADHVDIYEAAYLVDVTATTLDFDLTSRIEISDAELAWIVGAAKAAGLEVHEYMQVGGEDLNHVPLPTPPTSAWASAYLDAYTRFIVGRAALAQRDGIQAFQLDWDGGYWFDWTPLRDLFIAKMTAAAQQVRGVYSGKIL